MYDRNRNRHDLRRNSSWDIKPTRVGREKLKKMDGEIKSLARKKKQKLANKRMSKEEFRKRMMEDKV